MAGQSELQKSFEFWRQRENELVEQIENLKGLIAQLETKLAIGERELPAAQANRKIVEHKIRFANERAALQAVQHKPFTVINFNEVGLTMQGLQKRISMPGATQKLLPAHIVRLVWKGKSHSGVAMTIREPLLYEKPIDVICLGDPSEAFTAQTALAIEPNRLAFNLAQAHSPIFWARSRDCISVEPKNTVRTCGVLAFEGELEVLKHAAVNSRKHLRVPMRALPGDVGRAFNSTVSYPLGAYLKRMFAGMARYAELKRLREEQRRIQEEQSRTVFVFQDKEEPA